jgi:uncharacterized RDD family membrane protein YckC
MALFTVSTPFNIDLEFSLAAFHKRMFAWLIDLLLIFIYCYIMLFFVYENLIDTLKLDYENQYTVETMLVLFTVVIPVMFYHLIFEIFMNGRSPGKYVVGIKVMNKEGASATLSQLLLRWILCLSNYFSLLILMAVNPSYLLVIAFALVVVSIPDIISIAVTAHSQRLGDLAAGTVVVDTNYKMNIAETIYMEVGESDYTPVYPQVLQLSDRDINGIRNLLNGKQSKDSENYIYRVAYRIEEVLAIKMNSEPLVFLETLLKDYNYLTQNKG